MKIDYAPSAEELRKAALIAARVLNKSAMYGLGWEHGNSGRKPFTFEGDALDVKERADYMAGHDDGSFFVRIVRPPSLMQMPYDVGVILSESQEERLPSPS